MLRFENQHDMITHLANKNMMISVDGERTIILDNRHLRDEDDCFVDSIDFDINAWFKYKTENFHSAVAWLEKNPNCAIMGKETRKIYTLENGELQPEVSVVDLEQRFTLLPDRAP